MRKTNILMITLLMLLGLCITTVTCLATQNYTVVVPDYEIYSAQIAESNTKRVPYYYTHNTKLLPITLTSTDVNENIEIVEERYDFYWESVMCAKVVYCEARGIYNQDEQRAVVWTILNRVDAPEPYFADTIYEVITSNNNYMYSDYAPVIDDFKRDLVTLAQEVILNWAYDNSSTRVLPADYYYFKGDGRRNHFTNSYALFCSWIECGYIYNDFQF